MREQLQSALKRMDRDAFFKASVRRNAQTYLTEKAKRESSMTAEARRQEERQETMRGRKGKIMVFVYIASVFAVGSLLAFLGAHGSI